MSIATLRPCVEKSRGRNGEDGSFDSDNIYIEGDNLEVLKLLQRGYHGKVKMIYIDPPYNTGSDFVYKDKFGNTIESYKEQAGLAGQSNADTNGRYHSDWCSMMYPRLKVSRELLATDGILCMQIDDNEYGNLKKIADEIYGENCYMTTIAVKMSEPTGMKMAHATKRLPKLKEYILVYKKTSDTLINTVSVPKERWDNEYKTLITGLTKQDVSIIKSIRDKDKISIEDIDLVDSILAKGGSQPLSRSYESMGLESQESRNAFNFENAWRIVQIVSMSGGAKLLADEKKACGQQFYSVLTPQGKMYFINGNYSASVDKPRIKMLFADDYLTVHPCDFWQDIKTTGLDNEGYVDFHNGKKPLKLIERLLELFTNEGDLILDFFSGSATTAHAVWRSALDNLKARRFLLVQLPESIGPDDDGFSEGFKTICDLGEGRLMRSGNAIKSEVNESNRQLKLGEEPKRLPDIGFRVFALDESGIERPEPGQLALDVVKSDRTELDIVFEMMLKWGLELTLPVEKSDAAGYPIWSVACDELVCCMSRGLTIEALEAIADMEPRRVLILDSILDAPLKLNAVQIFKHAGERMGCEIELRTV